MDGKEYLEHVGVLGMKWGHRKSIGQTVSDIKKQRTKNDSEDHQVKVRLRGKKLNEMSNAELKVLTQRLQLEKQYKDLTKTDVSPGVKFVADLLVNAGKQTLQTYIQKNGAKGIDALVKKAISSKG